MAEELLNDCQCKLHGSSRPSAGNEVAINQNPVLDFTLIGQLATHCRKSCGLLALDKSRLCFSRTSTEYKESKAEVQELFSRRNNLEFRKYMGHGKAEY